MGSLIDELSHLRIRSHGLNKNNLIRIQIHPVRTVKFLASFDQDIRNLLRRRIGFGDNVIDVCQGCVTRAIPFQLSVVNRSIA